MYEKHQQLLKAVKQMRQLQKEFFSKERKASTQREAMQKEREVDNLIKEIENPEVQPSLFETEQSH